MILAAIPLTALDWVHFILAIAITIGSFYGIYRTVLLLIHILKQFPMIDDFGAAVSQAGSIVLQFLIWLVVGLIDYQLGVLFPN